MSTSDQPPASTVSTSASQDPPRPLPNSLLAHGQSPSAAPSPSEQSGVTLVATATSSSSTALTVPQPTISSLTRSLYSNPNGSTATINTRRYLKRDIGQQVERCFTTIIPISLDDNGMLATTFQTLGMKKYRKICSSFLSAGDLGFQTTSYVCNNMRRLNAHVTLNGPMSAQDKTLLVTNVINPLNTQIIHTRVRFEKATLEHKTLLEKEDLFMPTETMKFTLPQDLEGNVLLRITKLIKAQMVYNVGSDNIPEIFTTLQKLIAESEAYRNDCQAIIEAFNLLSTNLELLAKELNAPGSTNTELQDLISTISDTAHSYISKIPIVMSKVPKIKEEKYFANTYNVVTRTKQHWFSLESANSLKLRPIVQWLYEDIDSDSRTILAASMTLENFPSDKMAELLAVVSRVEEYSRHEYGIGIHVVSRINANSASGSWICRCDKLDISVKLGHTPAGNGMKVKIINHRPALEHFDKTESRYALKFCGKIAPSVRGIKVGEVAVERSREVTRSNYASMQSLQQTDDFMRWTLTRNRNSGASIADCDLGLVIMAPSPEIEIEVRIKATYRANPFALLPFKLKKTSTVISSSLKINLRDTVRMSFTAPDKAQAEFLQTCVTATGIAT